MLDVCWGGKLGEAGEDLFRALAGDALVDHMVCGAFAAEEDDLAVWGETELVV